jgi:prolyl 4-hydroxylase
LKAIYLIIFLLALCHETVQVDQEVDEPWPLEVYGHDGKAVNVTMEPGDMVLYESHSVIHGR